MSLSALRCNGVDLNQRALPSYSSSTLILMKRDKLRNKKGPPKTGEAMINGFQALVGRANTAARLDCD